MIDTIFIMIAAFAVGFAVSWIPWKTMKRSSTTAPRCGFGKHVWVWKRISEGKMFNIWKCQKCGEEQKTSIL
jgi:ribosomal protein L37AE/L43A